MLHQRPSFTCPASSGASTSEKNWDKAFMPYDEYFSKYGESPESTTPIESVPDSTGFSE